MESSTVQNPVRSQSRTLLRVLGVSEANRALLIPNLTALFVLLSGMLALAGRLHFPQALSHELPFLAGIPERAALGFILIGFSMRLARWENVNRWAHRKVKIFRILVVGLAAFTLAEHFGLAGRSFSALALPAGLCFLLLGLALMLRERFRICQFLICGSGLITLTALIACIYSAHAGLQIPVVMRIDAASGILLLVAVSGLLHSNSYRGLMAVVTSDTIGGSRARLLLPASILIPIFLGWIRLLCERAGLISNEGGLILHVVVTILLMAVVVWWNASTLVRTTTRKETVEEALREIEVAYRNVLDQSAEAIYISDVHGSLRYLNPAAERLFGYSNTDIQGMNIKRLLLPAGQRPEMLCELLGGPSHTRRMRLAGRSALEVEVFTTVHFREGIPVEVLAIVRAAPEMELQDESDPGKEPWAPMHDPVQQ